MSAANPRCDGAGRPELGAYRPTAVCAEAMQWRPGDLRAAGAMVGWLMEHGIDFRHPSGSGETTTLQLGGSEVVAGPGWWVVVDPVDGMGFVTPPGPDGVEAVIQPRTRPVRP